MTKIFLSWSGEISKAVAVELDNWLMLVLPEVRTWMSDWAIDGGAKWGEELDRQLDQTDFGIICVSPDNQASPWLLFESGALSKSFEHTKVVPYCTGVPPSDIRGPLARFQGLSSDKDGTLRLLRSINNILENKRSEEDLRKTFEKWWPDLSSPLSVILSRIGSIQERVTVRNILCASTPMFDQLGVEQDLGILRSSYPGANLVIKRNIGRTELTTILVSSQFEIVHLLGLVDPASGDFILNEKEKLTPDALLGYLQRSKTKMVFLATCDSLVLGAKLGRHMSVISAVATVTIELMTSWEEIFYKFMANGLSLATAYDLAQVTIEGPMMLIIRNDALFL